MEAVPRQRVSARLMTSLRMRRFMIRRAMREKARVVETSSRRRKRETSRLSGLLHPMGFVRGSAGIDVSLADQAEGLGDGTDQDGFEKQGSPASPDDLAVHLDFEC